MSGNNVTLHPSTYSVKSMYTTLLNFHDQINDITNNINIQAAVLEIPSHACVTNSAGIAS